jgi:hypothetical protein
MHRLYHINTHVFVDNSRVRRSLDFASRVEALGQAEVRKPCSVFSLHNVDPLVGMEPAVREVAQTRMFGERALRCPEDANAAAL